MKNLIEGVVGIGVLLLIGAVILGVFLTVKENIDKRNSRKPICAERIENIKNEFTAKKIYETCMGPYNLFKINKWKKV